MSDNKPTYESQLRTAALSLLYFGDDEITVGKLITLLTEVSNDAIVIGDRYGSRIELYGSKGDFLGYVDLIKKSFIDASTLIRKAVKQKTKVRKAKMARRIEERQYIKDHLVAPLAEST